MDVRLSSGFVRSLLASLVLTLWLTPAAAEPLVVAVAANFSKTLDQLLTRFANVSDTSVHVVIGSTGLLAAQIQQGAPYHVLLAADTDRPRALIASGAALEASLMAYATGRLALWTPGSVASLDKLTSAADGRLAMANPRLAPYGVAAEATLRAVNQWDQRGRQLIFGENVGAAYTLVATGNASKGLVAFSQLLANNIEAREYAEVPEKLYPPIIQAGVITRVGASHPEASYFLRFLASPAAQALIETAGYRPGGSLNDA